MWALPWSIGPLVFLVFLHGGRVSLLGFFFGPMGLGSFGPPSVHFLRFFLVGCWSTFLRVFLKPSSLGLEALSCDFACKTVKKKTLDQLLQLNPISLEMRAVTGYGRFTILLVSADITSHLRKGPIYHKPMFERFLPSQSFCSPTCKVQNQK